ncbi:MAG: hypothetical protein HYX63_00205 [Gammaproteobacteria bacterium]|nr:hypothetical protein [Gammaproteobacteria bacterium]
MYNKPKRAVALGVMLTTASAVGLVSEQAWSADESARIQQLEARVLKLEAASHEQSGMMKHMMKHKQPMAEKSMGGAMGTMPQPAPQMPASDGAPPAAPMAPGGGMGGDM